MNKNLIKENKAEFEHWLDGGEVMTRQCGSGWRLITDNHVWESAFAEYVISDDRVTIRMTEKDGKQLQYRMHGSQKWENTTTKSIIFKERSAAEYRLQPGFRDGDWVINLKHPQTGKPSEPFQIDKLWINCRPGGNTEKTGKDEDFIKWEPINGQWVIFWSNGKEKYYGIAPYHNINSWDNVAPLQYINKLHKDNNDTEI